MRGLRSAGIAVPIIAATVTAVTAAVGARSAASTFELVFDGRHTPDLLHEGTFTTSATFCSSGQAADVSVDSSTDTTTRTFRCSGSGEFTAQVTPLPAEHGGGGSWQIVGGSGAFANLRGKGRWRSIPLGGSSSDPATITFRSTWTGMVDFDVSPPTVAFSKATARKLKRPRGAYSLRLLLSLHDPEGNAVSYRLRVIDPRNPVDLLASKTGETSAGTVTYVLRVSPSRRTRALRVTVDATDPGGNTSTAARTLRCPLGAGAEHPPIDAVSSNTCSIGMTGSAS